MRKEDIKASFDNIKPDETAKSRMLDNIINHSYRKKEHIMTSFKFKKAIPALAMIVVIAGSVLTYNLIWGSNDPAYTPPGYMADGDDLVREDAVAPLLNIFKIDDKHYVLLNDDMRAEFGLPAAILESDIGEKIADIKESPDSSLIGCGVYKYTPAGGEAVVVVKRDAEYLLFKFFVFESYNNNQDEDAVRYLDIFGIKKPEDIAKIQFIGHTEESKMLNRTNILGEITDGDEIARFYGYFSKLKNSSDKYFEKLFGFAGTDSGAKNAEPDTGVEIDPAKPDAPVSTGAGWGNTVEAPDRIDYGKDQPLEQKPGEIHYAQDSITAIEKREIEAVSGDTPVASEPQPAGNATSGMVDRGDSGRNTSSPGVAGATNALAYPITIRIYNQSGVYLETVYYPAIRFISRFEVSEDFAKFMDNYIK